MGTDVPDEGALTELFAQSVIISIRFVFGEDF